MAATETETRRAATYVSYEGFLKTAIQTHWDRKKDRVHFLALLLATREAWEVAWDGTTAKGVSGTLLTGAAASAAIAILLRFVTGPLGIVLTGASVVSLVALYLRNHERIWAQTARYRKLVEAYRPKFQDVRGSYIDGKVEKAQSELMIDGLLSKFLDELETEPEPKPKAKDEPAAR